MPLATQPKGKTHELPTRFYHGTSFEAAMSIQRFGIKPSKDGVLGKGVYVTSSSKQAMAYANREAEQRHGGVCLKLHVDLGKTCMLEMKKDTKTDHTKHLTTGLVRMTRKPWQMTNWHDDGFDSASFLRPNGMYEACIYDASRVTIVKIKFGDEKRAKRAGYSVEDGLLMYKKPSERRIARSRSKGRKRDKNRQDKKARSGPGAPEVAKDDGISPRGNAKPSLRRQGSRLVRTGSTTIETPSQERGRADAKSNGKPALHRQSSRCLRRSSLANTAAPPSALSDNKPKQQPDLASEQEEVVVRQDTARLADDDCESDGEESQSSDGEERQQEESDGDEEEEEVEFVRICPTQLSEKPDAYYMPEYEPESETESWHCVRRRLGSV